MDHTALMQIALDEARAALGHGDIPVGAVIVGPDGEVVARDHNRREELTDPTAHAELLVLRAAAENAGSWRLDGHTLVVTLEPCVMCAGATVNARLDRLIYGAADLKAGGCWSLYNIPQDRRLNHNLEMEAGVLADECSELLTGFFEDRR
jgi:tRNA(adenine34) deaminase